MSEETLFHEAAATPPSERAAFLDAACAGQPQLRAEVEALLAAAESPASLLDRPPSGVRPKLDHDTPLDPLGPTTLYQPPIEPGLVIAGRYSLIQLIGEGGMAAVWLAQQTEPVKRKVALKLIKASMNSKAVLSRFEQERQALALMDHPNIARVLDGGLTPDGRPFFVMDLVNGLALNRFCDQARMTLRQRLELFVPICQAVQHAHQKGIIHRDLKPANILVTTQDGKAVPTVIDFGLAKATAGTLIDELPPTQHGTMLGTLEYMAPEQSGYNGLDIDTRADIYALGVILYELLTGLRPTDSDRLREAAWPEMLRILREEEPPRPSTRLSRNESLPSLATLRQTEPRRLLASLHGELDWVVMKCLEKQRDHRYETANGLARDIQRYLADEPVEARPPSTRYRLGKFLRRNKGLVLASVLVLLALVAGMVGTTVGMMQAQKSRDDKDAALQRAEDNATEARHQEQLALAQKQRAEEQAALALAVSDFLQQDLLGQADIGQQLVGPSEARDPDVKVRTLLDRASASIEGKFKDQPLTEAAIHLTIGNAYRALGRYEESHRHLERSLKLRTAKLGADHLDTVISENNLAQLYRAQRKYDLAEPLLKDVLQRQTANLGADHPGTLSAKNNLAMLYTDQRKYDLAESMFEGVLPALTAKVGADHPDTLQTKSNLATFYQAQRKYDLAEPLLKEVLQTHTAKLGADHPVSLISKNNLAMLYKDQRKYDLAEPLFKEALQTHTANRGADHPDTLTIKNNLAMLYWDHRKYDLAEPLFKEVLQTHTANRGADHPYTLNSKNILAIVYKTQRKYDLAEPLFKEVLQTLTAKLGADHLDTVTSENNLAQLYRAQGKYDLAEPLLKDVLQRQTANLGADHPDTLSAKNNLAMLYTDQGKYDLAESMFKGVLPALTAKRGADHSDTIQTKINLATFYQAQRKYDLAEPLLKEVLQTQTANLGVEHPGTLGTMAGLSLNLLGQKRYADAERLLRELLAISEKTPDLWSKFNYRSMLGEALAGQKKYAEAEPLLLQGYEGMKQREKNIPLQGKVHLTKGLELLVELYDAWGKKDKAEEYRKKLAEERAKLQPVKK